MTQPADPSAPEEHKSSNFLHQIIENDFEKSAYFSLKNART